jgi:hypothetical protein
VLCALGGVTCICAQEVGRDVPVSSVIDAIAVLRVDALVVIGGFEVRLICCHMCRGVVVVWCLTLHSQAYVSVWRLHGEGGAKASAPVVRIPIVLMPGR